MTRVLITFANPAERRTAARWAVRLTRRGVDVDVTYHPGAKRLLSDEYASVIVPSTDVAIEPLALGTSDGEGLVRIVDAGRARPGPAAPRRQEGLAVAAVVATAASLALALIGLPFPYPVALGVLVFGIACHVLETGGTHPADPSDRSADGAIGARRTAPVGRP